MRAVYVHMSLGGLGPVKRAEMDVTRTIKSKITPHRCRSSGVCVCAAAKCVQCVPMRAIAAARAHRHCRALALDLEHRALYGHQLSAVARLSVASFLERQLLELVHM